MPGEIHRVARAYRSRPDAAARSCDLVFFLIDLDDFKEVNDRYGHEAGHRLLAAAGDRLTQLGRRSDLIFRWGGEEFLFVFRDQRRANAALLAARVLEGIGMTPFELPDGNSVRLTCSIGWAPFPWDPTAPESAP